MMKKKTTKKTSKTKSNPSWRHLDSSGSDSTFRDCSSSSILRIHRGSCCIIKDILANEELSWESKLDVVYALNRISDCASELHGRTGKQSKPSKSQAGVRKTKCESKPSQSKKSSKTRKTQGSTGQGTSKQSKKASQRSGSRSQSSSTKKAKSSRATVRSKPRKLSDGKRSK